MDPDAPDFRKPEGPGETSQRLSKTVAALVPCSRSEAEQFIAQGWVRVDGRRVEEPQFRVTPGQRVEVDKTAQLQPGALATFLIHKPAGAGPADMLPLLGAANRWQGDASGVHRVKSHMTGLTALLPLPPPASGLAVLSQDGRIIRKLQEDARLIEQELLADVEGTIAEGGLARLGRGLLREGKPMPPARVSFQSEKRLRFAFKGIPPEAVPWMCAQVGLQLTALKRMRIGRLPLAGLPVGQWRYLGEGERF